jgi:hypothetical protein
VLRGVLRAGEREDNGCGSGRNDNNCREPHAPAPTTPVRLLKEGVDVGPGCARMRRHMRHVAITS